MGARTEVAGGRCSGCGGGVGGGGVRGRDSDSDSEVSRLGFGRGAELEEGPCVGCADFSSAVPLRSPI